MMLRYFTGENGKHYTAVVLKDNRILSLKKEGERDKTIYDSLIEWMTTLPAGATAADLDIKERETIPKPPNALKKETITLKDIAPNYDLLRFLLTYEAYSLKNSLVSVDNTYKMKTRSYVRDSKGNLHPVKYNRFLQKLYSEHHDKLGSTLEEIGFPKDAEIYVSVSGYYYYEKRYRDWSFSKVELPFTINDYESFYDAKFAFVVTPIITYCWANNGNDADYYHTILTNGLKEEGYHIFTQFVRYSSNDSIFSNKAYKYLEGNLVVVNPTFRSVVVQNYKPLGFVKIDFKEEDSVILAELKSILG